MFEFRYNIYTTFIHIQSDAAAGTAADTAGDTTAAADAGEKDG